MANLGKIVYLSEAQKNELFTNGSVTSNGTTITYNQNDLYVTPDTNVEDILVGGVSVVSNNSAIIPVAGENTLGVVKVAGGSSGIELNSNNKLRTIPATQNEIKLAVSASCYKHITPMYQDVSVFYGLTKAAGVDMASSSNEVGVYTDPAKGAIQTMIGVSDLIASREVSTATAAHAANSLFLMDGKLHKATAAIGIGNAVEVGTNCILTNISEAFPHDVQVNGTSVVTNGVANIPVSSGNTLGVVKTYANVGLVVDGAGLLSVFGATEEQYKAGTNAYNPVIPRDQHKSIYYGLSKLAGYDLASVTCTVGTYPTAAQTAIQSLIGVETGVSLVETITGTTPTLTCLPNVRYICGEVSTISITPPASGTCDVIFTSGSTATVLTVPNTVKFPGWYDASNLSSNTIYEIMITDGVYGSVVAWEN